jgi:hypothetical protein
MDALATRIAPLEPDELGLFARFALWMARRRLGKAPSSMQVLARHDRVLGAYGAMELGLGGANRLPTRLKALCSVRAAQLIGCPF